MRRIILLTFIFGLLFPIGTGLKFHISDDNLEVFRERQNTPQKCDDKNCANLGKSEISNLTKIVYQFSGRGSETGIASGLQIIFSILVLFAAFRERISQLFISFHIRLITSTVFRE